jgi:hypothetical protein
VTVQVVNIGSSTTVTGGAVTITVGAGGVPAGAHIIVCAAWNATSNLPTIADTASNTYQISGSATAQANNNTSALGASAIFRERTGGALVNGNTIVFTLPATSTLAAVSVFYATGLDAVGADSVFYNSTFGSSSTPSVTSNPPSGHHTDELVVAVVSGSSVITTYTQDSTNAAWASPPGVISTAAPVLGGGWFVNHAGGTLTYAPTFNTSDSWAATIVGFVSIPAWGFEPELPRSLPVKSSGTVSRYGAVSSRSGFAFFAPFVPMGWEVQSVQPPHPRPERSGAIARGDDGTQANFIPPPSPIVWSLDQQPMARRLLRPITVLRTMNDDSFRSFPWINVGYETQSVQPPHPRPERSGAIARGDDGTESQFVPPSVQAIFWGWDTLWVPLYLAPKNRGAAVKGKSEVGIFPNLLPMGWEIQSVQPPHPRPERAGAILFGELGIEAPFVPPIAAPTTWSYDWSPMLRRPAINRSGLDGTVEFAFFNLLPMGWEVQPVQPPYPRTFRPGAIMAGDSGIEATFVFTPPVVFPYGWEAQLVQPPHPRPERAGSVLAGETGTEAPFVFVPPAPVTWGYEQGWQPPRLSSTFKGGAVKGKSEFGIFPNLLPAGWEVQPVQPPHPRPERAGAVQVGDSGIEAAFIFTPPIVFPNGWEVQPVQPPHPRSERSGAIQIGDGGTQAAFIVWKNGGWEIVPHQPGHLRPERSAAIMAGDQGTEAAFVFTAPPITWGYEFSFQPPHPRLERAGAIKGKSEFGIFPNLLPAGWEVASFQPPHPRPEKIGAFLAGEPGIEAQFVFTPTAVAWGWEPTLHFSRIKTMFGGATEQIQIQFPTFSFLPFTEVQSVQPPHQRFERGGFLSFGDVGIEAPFVGPPTPNGWEYVTSPYVAHPRPERAGAIMRGDDGVEAQKINFFPHGWPVQHIQPPHPRSERWASTLYGDNGIQRPFIQFFRMGWEVQHVQPPHPRPERAASWLFGENGIEATYIVHLTVTFAGVGGLTASANLIQHICVIPGPGPAMLPSEAGPGLDTLPSEAGPGRATLPIAAAPGPKVC